MEVFYLDDLNKVRISKLLTEQNICSRTKAEKWVELKWIKSNGKIIEKPEHKVHIHDFILIDQKAFKELQNQKTILLNKPINYVSSFDDPKYEQAVTLVNRNNFAGDKFSETDIKAFQKSLGVVGRLDADSRGLLLFTQDGSFAKSIIGPESNVEKEYLVKVNGKINEDKLKLLRFGLKLDDQLLKKAIVEEVSPKTLKFILTEGKKRQIRRMCKSVDLEVIDLKRIRIGNIHLPKDLKEGQWIYL